MYDVDRHVGELNIAVVFQPGLGNAERVAAVCLICVTVPVTAL
jgi:hypothetical protein